MSSTKLTPREGALMASYAKKMQPLVPLAKKAYGLRGQDTPEHRASTKYTALLKEYRAKGGQLAPLAKELGVHYSGLRRRAFSGDISSYATRKRRSTFTPEQTEKYVSTIADARLVSEVAYHAAIYKAYQAGASLAAIAKGLSLSSSGALYYAVTRHEERLSLKKSA